jgi:predicted alpha-1,2-mannosidase
MIHGLEVDFRARRGSDRIPGDLKFSIEFPGDPSFSARRVRAITMFGAEVRSYVVPWVLMFAAAVLVLVMIEPPPVSAASVSQVNAAIGTGAPGDAFVGAQLPFGFAAPGPDTLLPTTSGYSPGEPIIGFSMTHDSGTGGAADYGNFRVTPAVPGHSGPAEAVDERAVPGYYSVRLGPSGIRVQLTASRLAALERFTYPAATQATLTLNAASVIDNLPTGEVARRAWVRITGRRSFEGGGVFGGGFAGGEYKLFFAAQLDRTTHLSSAAKSTAVVATFGIRRSRVLTLGVGISFTSAAMAARHLAELPGFNFGLVVRRAQAQWRAVLGDIQVQGGTAAQREILATSLYHSQLMPHDLMGDGGWPAGKAHYEDFFTLWDTFRTLDPLLELTEPHRMTAMVNSLLETYKLTGWLPDARVATTNGITQVGSNGDVVVADALVKGLGGIDYRTALRALSKDATVQSPDPWLEGRILSDWNRLHYVALDQSRSASRTLEYAYDNFAISEVAQRLGDTREAAAYRASAGYWANLWDPSTQSIRPRYQDGSFLNPFTATLPMFGIAPFFEGSALEWSTFVPQDVQGVINRVGGDQHFVAWLQRVMACCYDPSNEPDLLAPWLYIHAGRPDLTDATVRHLLASAYGTGRNGLPGDDDAGSLSAWYVWSAIGLYPNAGQPYYYIGAPLFTRVRIRVGGRRTFMIEAPHASPLNQYVVGATLDHRVLRRAFLTSGEVQRGGTLVLQMAATPDSWGRGPRPFSLSSPASAGSGITH